LDSLNGCLADNGKNTLSETSSEMQGAIDIARIKNKKLFFKGCVIDFAEKTFFKYAVSEQKVLSLGQRVMMAATR
jgi:hypothetical protein